MKVRARLFAMLRERAGTGDVVAELPEGSPVHDLWDTVRRQHDGLSGVALKLLYAVNSEYVAPDHRLADGDEVAFIPPVSGG